MKTSSNDESFEDVSYNYDIESLFTSIPVQEIIDYVLEIIYVRKDIKPFCKKSIFKKLLLKLIKYVFSVNNRLKKQIDGCPMGGPISLVYSDIYVSKMEKTLLLQ